MKKEGSITFAPLAVVGRKVDSLVKILEKNGRDLEQIELYLTDAPGYCAYHDETHEVIGYVVGSSEKHAERPILVEKYHQLVLSSGEQGKSKACILIDCVVEPEYEGYGIGDELLRLFIEEASLNRLYAHVLAQVAKKTEVHMLEALTQKGFSPFASQDSSMFIWLSRAITPTSTPKSQTQYKRIALEEEHMPNNGTW